MAKKKPKKSRKPKQPTKAEIEARRLQYEQELEEEAALLGDINRLCEVYAHSERFEKSKIPAVRNLVTLLRMYKRKWHEANELRDYLIGVKEMLEGGWDEDEEYFDESFVGNRLAPGHWCPGLIEEIGEMTDEGSVYSPFPIPTSVEV